MALSCRIADMVRYGFFFDGKIIVGSCHPNNGTCTRRGAVDFTSQFFGWQCWDNDTFLEGVFFWSRPVCVSLPMARNSTYANNVPQKHGVDSSQYSVHHCCLLEDIWLWVKKRTPVYTSKQLAVWQLRLIPTAIVVWILILDGRILIFACEIAWFPDEIPKGLMV